MSIEIKNLTKYYGTQKALDNVSFSVGSGTVVGFLGPNGAGKSTLMKIVTGLLSPTSGTVLVEGLDVAENINQIKKIIGYLPENNPLYLDMYVKEYLQYTANIYHLSNTDKVVDEVIGRTGLEAECRKKIGALSKGYKQRVGLAQAIIHNPQVLILDEPTTGLDPNQIVEIRNLILELGREKTILLSTHIMQEVQAICHQMAILDHGVLVANDNGGGYTDKLLVTKMLLHMLDGAIAGEHTTVRCIDIRVVALFLAIKDIVNGNMSAVVVFIANIDQPYVLVNGFGFKFQRLLQLFHFP